MDHSEILIVCPRFDVGGTERHLLRIMTRLRNDGLNVGLYLLARGGKLEPELISAGVPVFGPPDVQARAVRAVVSGWQLYRHLSRHKPDIVHFFLPEAYLVGMAAAIAAKIESRIMSRRSLSDYQKAYPLLRMVEARLHRHAKALLGNSRAVVEQLVAEGADSRKVGLIYNGISLRPLPSAEQRRQLRAAFAIDPATLLIVMVANLIAYKGHCDLFEALGQIKDRMPKPWKLLLIGRDDGIGTSLKMKAQEVGIAAEVLWLGERPDAEQLLDLADISVVSSHEEGFSNSLIEAMASGLPVIATNVGGNKDAVIHGVTGLLVAPRAPDVMALAILELACDADRRKRMGDAGRKRIEGNFSLETCVAKYRALYQRIGNIDCMSVEEILDGSHT